MCVFSRVPLTHSPGKNKLINRRSRFREKQKGLLRTVWVKWQFTLSEGWTTSPARDVSRKSLERTNGGRSTENPRTETKGAKPRTFSSTIRPNRFLWHEDPNQKMDEDGGNLSVTTFAPIKFLSSYRPWPGKLPGMVTMVSDRSNGPTSSPENLVRETFRGKWTDARRNRDATLTFPYEEDLTGQSKRDCLQGKSVM